MHASSVARRPLLPGRMFPAPEQKQPGLMTYPDNNSVSLVVQMEAWVANHLDPNLERELLHSVTPVL